MNRLMNVIITSRTLAAWAVLAIATAAFAHAGFRHVVGTIGKVSGHVLTIKTTKGDVDVKLNDHTQLTRNDRKAQLADLQTGARVVAEVPEESKDNVAQSVKIGVVTKTAAVHQKHTAHK